MRKIYINSTRYPATWNLDSALRHLRDKVQPSMFWVDALFIDQTNVEERNSQAKRMGTVYKTVSEVIAWLGPEYANSDLVFDFFDVMRKTPHSLGIHECIHH